MMDSIESKSLQLIKTVLDHYSLPDYGRFLVERAVHATADFSIASLFVIQPGFIETSLKKIESGSEVYCDSEMVSSGISPCLLQQCGIKLTVFVHERECYARAQAQNRTRSEAAIDICCEKGIRNFIFGNTPTGLLRLIHHIHQGYQVNFVIGMPVGFISAAISKNQLIQTGVPAIILSGPRGGSTIAASVFNALLKKKLEDEKLETIT